MIETDSVDDFVGVLLGLVVRENDCDLLTLGVIDGVLLLLPETEMLFVTETVTEMVGLLECVTSTQENSA